MAIITQGTPIKKVLSGGTPIQKVMSNGTQIWTNAVTITIPAIANVATQTLKVGSTTIYSGAGGAGVTVTVQYGSSVAITATPATGYNNPTVTTPVTANADFSTASYITAGSVREFILTKSVITGVATQQVVRNSSPLQDAGLGELSSGATIYYGDVLGIFASASSGYTVNVTTPVTVTGNIATSNYITADVTAEWNFEQYMSAVEGDVKTVTNLSGLKINTYTEVYCEILTTGDAYKATSGTISSTTDSLNANNGQIGADRAVVKLSIITANQLRIEVTTKGDNVNSILVSGTLYQ